MRNAIVEALIKIAQKDKNIYCLTADLGYSVLEAFRARFPQRFYNVGVAEQNMIGVAAGLALCSKTVFTYSIIPFTTFRCLEQIRNDVCAQNLNVKIIGMGSGLHYGPAGSTHHSLEDISIMRSLPGMTVIVPSTAEEAAQAISACVKYQGPVYIRIGKSYPHCQYKRSVPFRIGKAILVNEGKDIALLFCGNMLTTALDVVTVLEKEGVSVRLVNVHTIKPIDEKTIIESASMTSAIYTLEEHSIIGGLSSSVAEVLAQSGIKTILKPFALQDAFVPQPGKRDYLLNNQCLSAKKIVQFILNSLHRYE